MSHTPIMTGYEQHEYRRSLRQRADKRRALTRREARRLKRKEGTGIDVEFSIPKAVLYGGPTLYERFVKDFLGE